MQALAQLRSPSWQVWRIRLRSPGLQWLPRTEGESGTGVGPASGSAALLPTANSGASKDPIRPASQKTAFSPPRGENSVKAPHLSYWLK